MSALDPPPATTASERLLVDNPRRGIDIRLVPVVLGLGLLHAVIGLTWSDLLSLSTSAVLILSVVTMLSAAGVLLRSTTDRFELFRAFSFYYFVSFALAPLMLPSDLLNYYELPKSALLTRAAGLSLFAYVCIAVGYHLPVFRPPPSTAPLRAANLSTQKVLPFALVFFIVGVVGFIILFLQAGGVAVILQGKGDLARNEFFTGIGWFFWLSMFMIPGGAMYFAAMAYKHGRRGWIHGWPLFVAFAFLLTLQGRHRALGPMIIALVMSNYLVRRIRLRRLVIYGLLGLTLSIIVGIVRSPSLRPLFAADPVGVSVEILQEYPDHVRRLLVVDMSRMAELMVVVDKIPSRVGYFSGISFFQVTSPFLRLANLHEYQPLNIGLVLYPLARPEVSSDTRTGFLPSIVGEMRANFPWYLCTIPYLLFGMLMRVAYQSLILLRGDMLAVAAYATVGLFLCNTVIGTFNQNLFEELLLLLPILLVRFMLRGGAPPRFHTHESAALGSSPSGR